MEVNGIHLLGVHNKIHIKLFIIVTFQLCKHCPIDILCIYAYSSFKLVLPSQLRPPVFQLRLDVQTQKCSCAVRSNSNQAVFWALSTYFQREAKCQCVDYASQYIWHKITLLRCLEPSQLASGYSARESTPFWKWAQLTVAPTGCPPWYCATSPTAPSCKFPQNSGNSDEWWLHNVSCSKRTFISFVGLFFIW